MPLMTSANRARRLVLVALGAGLLAGCGHMMGMRHAGMGMSGGAAGGCCCGMMGAGAQHAMQQGAAPGQLQQSSPSTMAPAPGQASGRFVPPMQTAAGPMCGDGGACGGGTAGSASGCACCGGMMGSSPKAPS